MTHKNDSYQDFWEECIEIQNCLNVYWLDHESVSNLLIDFYWGGESAEEIIKVIQFVVGYQEEHELFNIEDTDLNPESEWYSTDLYEEFDY